MGQPTRGANFPAGFNTSLSDAKNLAYPAYPPQTALRARIWGTHGPSARAPRNCSPSAIRPGREPHEAEGEEQGGRNDNAPAEAGACRAGLQSAVYCIRRLRRWCSHISGGSRKASSKPSPQK
jgi:hypothetical protein